MVSSDPDAQNKNNELMITPTLEKEIVSVINKERKFDHYKTDKNGSSAHDSLKKFKSEFLNDENKTIDLNQLKLDLNFGSDFMKKQASQSNPSFKQQEQDPKEAKKTSKSQSFCKEGTINNVFI